MNFNISPIFNNTVQRSVDVTWFSFSDDKNIMEVDLTVKHTIAGEIVKDLEKTIRVTVDNNNPIIPNSEGDFDYIYAMLATTPITAILEMSVGLLDSLGVIDAKCNYNAS